jgi:predicted DNA-binding WGR domain protein
MGQRRVRYFELRSGSSNKFWEITLQGRAYSVRFGKIGASGQTRTTSFGSEEAAKQAANKLMWHKHGKGYQYVSGKRAAGAAPFDGFDLSDFWAASAYAKKSYVEPPPTDTLIASVEGELGVRLPASYTHLMRLHNGGTPHNTCFPTKVATSWAEDHVAITGIMGIGRTKNYALCGSSGSAFMQEEWGYPPIGICVCTCPSAGHDMIMLDYRQCGPEGEPEVVHVDQERDYAVTFLARDFEAFVRGLVHPDSFDTSEDDLTDDLSRVARGSFLPLLSRLIAAADEPRIDAILREVCRRLTVEKGYFALHADELSRLVYDIQFYLYSSVEEVRDAKQYLEVYEGMIALGGGGDFSTMGYAPGFVEAWLKERIAREEIVASSAGGLVFSAAQREALLGAIRRYG